MIGPMAALESFLFNALKWNGRATRAEYWWAWLARFIGFFVVIFWDMFAVFAADAPPVNPFSYLTIWFFVLTLIPSITLAARRLHDTGRSSMWWFVNLVPMVGGLWYILLLCRKSDEEENRWGPANRHNRGGYARSGKPNPYQSYAVLINADRPVSEDELAARREAISDYYQRQVLGKHAPG
ncbi:DUF805 domain-containing protein [Cognatishimia sp. F0-27]|uniref:DUF805 domain-containing protein n=1 Tax=Cognatishimia sp. F0-27 TaxID=2816855 RepID=UPI001D0CD459|nr:DUF805 domain-containing protein [Cognatishimia sp. F0-27]MCC1494432.1 DUF805 domain-containing protein [Cognatishimia sp. F0-27]